MTDTPGVLEFSIAIIVLIAVVISVYIVLERKKRSSIKKEFEKFSRSYRISRQNLRTVPRVVIPDLLEVDLTVTDNRYFGLKASALDISLSGFSVRPDFPLRKLPLNTHVKNILVVTPVNSFVVEEMKTVRIDHQMDRRLMAFHIEKIAQDQFELLKDFMTYLDEFLKAKHAPSAA